MIEVTEEYIKAGKKQSKTDNPIVLALCSKIKDKFLLHPKKKLLQIFTNSPYFYTLKNYEILHFLNDFNKGKEVKPFSFVLENRYEGVPFHTKKRGFVVGNIVFASVMYSKSFRSPSVREVIIEKIEKRDNELSFLSQKDLFHVRDFSCPYMEFTIEDNYLFKTEDECILSTIRELKDHIEELKFWLSTYVPKERKRKAGEISELWKAYNGGMGGRAYVSGGMWVHKCGKTYQEAGKDGFEKSSGTEFCTCKICAGVPVKTK